MFRDMTISKKLTLLLMSAAASAVLFACLIFYVVATEHFQKSYEDDLSSLARIIVNNCEAPLAFSIREEAERVLASLSERPSIVYAVVRDGNGSNFAAYGKPPQELGGGSANTPPNASRKWEAYLVTTQNIVISGKVAGTLTLFDDMRGIHRMQRLAFPLILLAVLLSLGGASVIGSVLKGIISGPILALSGAAQRITREQDFSVRAEKLGNDEVGQLVSAFNLMLAQIEKRNLELLSSEKRFRTLVDQAVDAFFLFDFDGKIVDVNQCACESLGYSREELLSLTVRDIQHGSSPGLSGAHSWEEMEMNRPVTTERLHRRKDDTILPVEMRLGLLEIGEGVFVMGLARDLSERLNAAAEKEKLESELLQAQKMEAIGHLAGGIAHDFNNLLTPVIGYADIMSYDFSPDDPHFSKLQLILKSAMKAKELTQKLLSFGRKQLMHKNVLDMNAVISSFEEILKRTIRENISLDFRLSPQQSLVNGDKSQLELLLLNLVINGQDAIDGRGTIAIETGNMVLDDEYCRHHPGARPGEYALLSISDTGSGMSREVLDHMFEPFYTTKPVGKGTGLGLATVYGIVRQHEGHVTVFSEEGTGTCFRIFIPLSREALAESSIVESIGEEACVDGGIILLAEDNEMVRSMCKELLESRGYTVFAVATPVEAIVVAEQIGTPVDLLITDVVMPEMNGHELFERLLGMQPDLKVLYISGYTNDHLSYKSFQEEGRSFLQKPFTRQSLLARVKEVISA